MEEIIFLTSLVVIWGIFLYNKILNAKRDTYNLMDYFVSIGLAQQDAIDNLIAKVNELSKKVNNEQPPSIKT